MDRLRAFDVRPLRIPLSILGAVFVIASFIPAIAVSHGYDLTSYWQVNVDYDNVTDLSGQGPFRYAPVVAMALAPLGLLSWEALVVVWLCLQLAALYYIGRGWALALVLFPPVWLDIVYGNINIFLAAMIVAGFRYPGVWAFALFTKVTPAVGLVWFAARREWRALGSVILTIAVLLVASVIIQGADLWLAWFRFLATSTGMAQPADALPVPLLPRLVAAGVLAGWGGLTNRHWTVPVAVTMAMPTLWLISLAPLVALAGLPRVTSRNA